LKFKLLQLDRSQLGSDRQNRLEGGLLSERSMKPGYRQNDDGDKAHPAGHLPYGARADQCTAAIA
jgi:hypothetical protein